MVISPYGESQRKSKELPHLIFFLSDTTVDF
jgi:hypothetical protein